jgi:hypothetical protein
VRTAAWAVGLLVLLGAAAAWACVPQPIISSVQPRASGPAGGQVTVVGDNFDRAPVEIRWNGVQGPLLGTGNGPIFSIPVTIPDDVEGLYVLTALSRQPGGGVGGTARASFQVQGASGEAATAPAAQPAPPAAEPSRVGVLVGGAVGVFAAGALVMLLYTRLRRPRG